MAALDIGSRGTRLALALWLCACGGGDDSDSTSVAGSSEGPGSTTSASSVGPDDGASAGPGETGGSSGVDPSTSATGVDPVTDDGGVTTGGSVDACSDASPQCPDGHSCRASACCDGAGYCILAASPSCGGFVGGPCPDALVCVTDACVADGQGRCLDAAAAAALDAAQPGCWNAG